MRGSSWATLVVAASLVAPSSLAAQTRHQLLVMTGDSIPSRSTTFGAFDRVRVLQSGDVSFTGGFGEGVFVATALTDGTSTVAPILQVDDPAGLMGRPMSVVVGAPRFPVSFGRSRFVYAANAAGSFAIGADYRPDPALPDQTLGLFRGSAGALELVTDGRALDVPRAAGGSTMDALDGNVLEATLNAAGDVLFLMGPFSRFDGGLFVLSAGVVRNVAFVDDPVLTDPATLGAPVVGRRDIRDIQLSDAGTVLFVTDDGAGGPVAVWRERAGAVELILVEGDAPRLLGETITEVRDVVLGPTGAYMIDCAFERGGGAIYGGDDSDALEVFAESDPRGEVTTVRAGGTVSFTGLEDLVVSPAGNYFFTATATLDDGARADGIWRRTGSDGTLAFYLRDGHVYEAGEEPLRSPVIQDINLGRDVVFSAVQQSPTRASLWIRRGADYKPLVTEGDVLGDGLVVTNARGDRPIVRASLNDAGEIALRLGVELPGPPTTPGEALFYTTPAAVGESTANLGFLETGSAVTLESGRIHYRMLVFNDGPDDVTPRFTVDVQAAGTGLSDPRMVFSAEAGAIVGPDEVTLAASSPVDASCSPTDVTETGLDARCEVSAPFPADASRAHTVDLSFAVGGEGAFAATFTIGSALTDPDNTDNVRSDSLELLGADLRLELIATRNGQGTWQVHNDGPEPALNVRFAVEGDGETFRAERTAPVADPTAPPCGSEVGGAFCDLDRLGVGQTMTVVVGATATCFELRASAFAETTDPDESNNTGLDTNAGSEACEGDCGVARGSRPPPLGALVPLLVLMLLRRRARG